MGHSEYVVKLSEGSFGLINSTLPADIRPLCFEGSENVHQQQAECSAHDLCKSGATLAYSLNAKVAVEDASTHAMALKHVAMIDTDAKQLRFVGDAFAPSLK